MAKLDFSEDDDFYTQGFEKNGVISVWIGIKVRRSEGDIDALRELCGVGYYRLSDQESSSFEYELTDLSKLIEGLSYSSSFIDAVISAAHRRGVKEARRVVVQYDFAYDPQKVSRNIEGDPLFLGVFEYSVDG